MTDRRFEYDEDLLKSCARSGVAAFVVEKQNQSYFRFESLRERELSEENDNSCVLLFHLHAHHYGRHHAKEESFMVRKSTLDNTPQENVNATIQLHSYELGSKMDTFIRNVVLVESHNSAAAADNLHYHRVALNRFSDLRPSQVLAVERVDPADLWSEKSRRLAEAVVTDHDGDGLEWVSDASKEHGTDEATMGSGVNHLMMPVRLSTPEKIMEVAANYAIGHGSMHQLYKYKKQNPHNKVTLELYPTKIQLPTQEELNSVDGGQFQTPALERAMDGTLISIRQNKEYRRHHSKHSSSEHDEQGSFSDDEFTTYVNWATVDNPDGVAVVHDAIDQGTCGSCWASSATGSLEASAARREAYDAYTGYSAADSPNGNMESLREEAFLYAQEVERQSFQKLNLSIQELLDCDSLVDQGCTGGNPLLAFYFIHRYGLTSAELYPYAGVEGKCNKKLANYPIATVNSWGILPPNSEKHMELAIRHIGPIAVGVNGADPSFLSYDGGIFSKLHCKQASNHALLIVGYGEEETLASDGNTTRTQYWIARNSWGQGWGENGFIRIKRGDGRKGTPGQCGIARSPSVALGGILLQNVKMSDTSGLRGGKIGDNRAFSDLEQMHHYTLLEKFCLQTGSQLDGRCGQVSDLLVTHKAVVLGLVGIFAALLVVWPLTRDCRRRSHRRRLRRLHHLDNHFKSATEETDEETSPLITNESAVVYGTNNGP